MLFAHDTEVALQSAAALVNTRGIDEDTLTDLETLDDFVATWRLTGTRTHDATELEQVRAVRPRLRRLWELDEDGVIAEVNTILAEYHARPQLMKHDGWTWHLHAAAPEASLADRIAVEAAMAFVDVVRLEQLDRLRVCGASDCEDVVVDLSKNSSRRYCSSQCSNRTNVAAFRARQR